MTPPCAHMQRRPGTSEAGMHGCGKDHGLHFARQQHACTDWQPIPQEPLKATP